MTEMGSKRHAEHRVRPTYLPPRGSGRDAGTLTLSDGTRLALQRALPEDALRLGAFLDRLSADERRQVREGLRLGEGELDAFLESLAQRPSGEAFFAELPGGEERVVGFGAYRLLDEAERGDCAALSFAVDPELRGRGAARLLLERLTVLASQRGVDHLVGGAPATNQALVELFRRSGFEVEERREGGSVTFVLDPRAAALAAGREDGLGARAFTAASLRSLFHPRSVAVIGASREPGSVGRRILDALVQHRFDGPVYPVNPKADHVGSIRAYPTLAAIGRPVDLAVIAVPERFVTQVVDQCAAAGVKGLVVITAGFAETGAEGRERQRALLEQVRGAGMRMVGPNCLGLLQTDPEVSLNASFAPHMPPRGRVALSSQSGALGVAIIALARSLGLGMSTFVSVGNKADVSGNDLLEYWEEDPSTDVVLFYLESFGNPRRFARIARRVGRSKPLVVVKGGRTEAGGRAASSHTAALTAADTAVDALFRQTGILRADTLTEMFGIARVLADQPLPPGPRAAVVTNAGGPAILCADALESSGMEVRPLSAATRERLARLLPAAASTTNPVDMIASAGPDTFRQVVEEVLASDEVDAMIVIYTPVGMFDTGEVSQAILDGVTAARGRGGAGKPVIASIVGAEEEIYRLPGRDETIPAYPFPEEMGRILGKIHDYARWRDSDPGSFPELAGLELERAAEICHRALAERGAGWLGVEEARQVLAAVGLQVGAGGVATTADEAAALAGEIGFPVAAKLASREIVHKTEVGGVALGLDSAEAVREAFRGMERRLEAEGQRDAMEGVLVQPMLSGSAEVMIGVDHDPVFGPIVAFGLGGIHVEILRDVAFRVSPLTDRDAREMVESIRGYRLLQGYRGHPAADVPALEEALLRVSRLVEAVPEISEIDCNPVFALEPGEGYRVVDARIKVRRPAAAPE
ncbi:MAG TPA: GNAT family N-acetyltransferase [Thermoanaerobaculia bacterium]|nr:GNAT family N-acetyltransferase [Thermoanaerobaculia bacterium]